MILRLSSGSLTRRSASLTWSWLSGASPSLGSPLFALGAASLVAVSDSSRSVAMLAPLDAIARSTGVAGAASPLSWVGRASVLLRRRFLRARLARLGFG